MRNLGFQSPRSKLSVWMLLQKPTAAAEGSCLFTHPQEGNPSSNILQVLITTWRKLKLQFSVNYSVKSQDSQEIKTSLRVFT
jgi:hypothetical protein